jgi:hypothetical protein
VRHAFYLGSPHQGAPLEKLGGVVTGVLKAVGIAHTDLVADVIDLRSQGIKDLGRGLAPAGGGPPLPLAPGVTHHFLVGGLGPSEAHVATVLLGDALVRVASAAARHPGSAVAPVHVQFFPRVGHLALARHPEVYAWMKRALSRGAPAGPSASGAGAG